MTPQINIPGAFKIIGRHGQSKANVPENCCLAFLFGSERRQAEDGDGKGAVRAGQGAWDLGPVGGDLSLTRSNC